MEKITAQEALHRFAERYKEKIINGERKNLTGGSLNMLHTWSCRRSKDGSLWCH